MEEKEVLDNEIHHFAKFCHDEKLTLKNKNEI